jgi:glycosyltransferase involved in cell wall biosynthesis
MMSDVAPRVSIVLPAYQHAAHVGETVRAVLAQSFAAWELLVVDDGSTDGTGDVVAGIAVERGDRRVRLERRSHGGVSVARNAALAEVRGDYVAFLDADDPWPPDRLGALVQALDADPDLGLAYTDRLEVDDGGRPLRLRVGPAHASPDNLLRGFPFAPSDCLVRRSWARQAVFPPGIVINEDREYFFRLHLAGCAMRKVDAPLARRRRYPGRTFSDLDGLLADRLHVLDRALGHPACPDALRARRPGLRRRIFRDLAWVAVEARDTDRARRWLVRGIDGPGPARGPRHAGPRGDALDRWLVWSGLRYGDDPEPALRWLFDRFPRRVQALRPAEDRVVRGALLRAGLREHVWGRVDRAEAFLERAGPDAPVGLVEDWVVRQLARLDATTPRDRVPGDPRARARIAAALEALGRDGRRAAGRVRLAGAAGRARVVVAAGAAAGAGGAAGAETWSGERPC